LAEARPAAPASRRRVHTVDGAGWGGRRPRRQAGARPILPRYFENKTPTANTGSEPGGGRRAGDVGLGSTLLRREALVHRIAGDRQRCDQAGIRRRIPLPWPEVSAGPEIRRRARDVAPRPTGGGGGDRRAGESVELVGSAVLVRGWFGGRHTVNAASPTRPYAAICGALGTPWGWLLALGLPKPGPGWRGSSPFRLIGVPRLTGWLQDLRRAPSR